MNTCQPFQHVNPCSENTLLGRCMQAYNDAPGMFQATPSGIAMVMEHLAAEIVACQLMRGAMDANDVAHWLLHGAKHERLNSQVSLETGDEP